MLILSSMAAGLIGSLLGLGGGIIIVPVLTLVFNVDIRFAIPVSLISIIATSSAATSIFLKNNLTNIRIASLLEIGTVLGALTGIFISSEFKSSWLFILFGFFLLFSAVMMFRKRSIHTASTNHPLATKLKLENHYIDEKKQIVHYQVANVPLSILSMYFAGIFSSLLGIGSGIFKVVAMDGAMGLPIKVSSATSNFMIGVTALASAGAYFLRGDVRPELAGPVVLGVIVGARLGAKILGIMSPSKIRKIFTMVIIIVAIQMIHRGFKTWNI